MLDNAGVDEHDDDPYEVDAPRAISMTDMSVDSVAEGSAADMLVAQSRSKVIALLVLLGIAGVAAYFHLFVHPTEPDSVLVAVRVDDGEGAAAYWWGGNEAAMRLHDEIEASFEPSGLRVLPRLEETRPELEGVSEQEELREAAARLGAGHVLLVSLSTRETIEVDNNGSDDFVFSLEIGVLDVDAGTVTQAEQPFRVFLWGEDVAEAMRLNARHTAALARGTALELLAAQPRLAHFAGDITGMNSDERVLAMQLEPLFTMAGAHTNALQERREELAEAEAEEFVEHSGKPRTRLGGYLDQDYMIGTAPDGRLVIKHDPHLVFWREGIEYDIDETGEQLWLANADGGERERVFEFYNVFSYPGISADGSTVSLVLDNHGVSKSLAVVSLPGGERKTVLEDFSEYYSTPKPSPDGSLLAFYARPARRSPSSLEVVEVASSKRTVLLNAGTEFSQPSWSPSGELFIAIGEDRIDRVVKFDPRTGALTHLLGVDLDAVPEADADEQQELEPVEGEEAAEPDPVLNSRFDRVSVNHDGSALYVAEIASDGRDYVGRFELATGNYVRLAELEAYKLLASPSADRVALQTTSGGFTAKGDPSSSDTEVLVLGPEPGEPEVVTLNAIDEDLMSWSRDGGSLFVSDQRRDPSGDRYAARIYRYDLD